MAAWRILVVDDDAAVRSAIVEILRYGGYQTVEAEDGAEALQIFTDSNRRIDLVLLDMSMPCANGWWFAEMARRSGLKIPIIVVSAGLDVGAWAKEIRADAYLAKPFHLTDLLDVVAQFCPPSDDPPD